MDVLSVVLLGRAAECFTKISDLKKGGKICAINYIKSLGKKRKIEQGAEAVWPLNLQHIYYLMII